MGSIAVDLPSAHEVPAEGVLPYMHVAVPTDFPEDKWISAYEIRVSAPEVVHHVLAFLHYPKDHPHRSEQQEVRGGVGGYFALYAPGGAAYRMPPGTAKRLPRGGTLVFQIHYTPNGEAARNRTKIGLWFSEKPPEHQLISTGIHNHRFKIPAGHPNYPVRASKVVPVRARVFGFMPHMHLRGKAFRFEAVLPDGSRRMLLDVPAFDFNWQLTYQLRDPIELPAGTRIETTGWYDNSADNPANPDPTRDVPWGEQTFDEMQLGYVEWHPVK